jgi:glucose uptake protein GlcU
MSRLSDGRKFVAVMVAIVVLAAGFVITATSQEALAASNCTYYSNGSHTTVVGQFGYDCCNNPVAWGVKTQFKVCGGCFLCFPPPR